MANYAASMVRAGVTPALLKLCDVEISESVEDIRGRRVIDSNGETLGHVRDLLVDRIESKIRGFLVTPHGPLALSHTDLPVPADAITRIEGDTVLIGCTSEHVAGSPHCCRDLIEDCYWEEVYAYYGYKPGWKT